MTEAKPDGKAKAAKDDVQLSSGRLKAVNRTSALMAGFAMVAMVELSIPDNSKDRPPEGLLAAHATCTTLLVAVHLLALTIGMYVLPNIEVAINVEPADDQQNDLPQYSMRTYITIAWYCSTIVGIPLFMVEICILCWVKFYHVSHVAAIVSSCLIVPVCVVFGAFVVHYHRRLDRNRGEALKK